MRVQNSSLFDEKYYFVTRRKKRREFYLLSSFIFYSFTILEVINKYKVEQGHILHQTEVLMVVTMNDRMEWHLVSVSNCVRYHSILSFIITTIKTSVW